ncbi:MAG: 3'(2'),5'-bisphosphate nucleotidase CysQ [Pseudomonadota bacterium]|nr:3'(2'),5'-bisphosphate nucleotidase CysQ [Pseudomonadota bacterium]
MIPPIPTRELGELRDQAISVAIAAGNEIHRIYNGEYTVREKADRTPVTTADLAANQIIVERLTATAHGFPVLAEESDRCPFATRSVWDHYWLVDPLDGTREFIKGNGEFCVSIALVSGHDAVVGVIHSPITGTTWHAVNGGGAWKRPGEGPDSAVTTRATPATHPVVAGSRSHATGKLGVFLQVLGPHDLIPMGSAIKSCLVAEGTADIYPRFGPTSEWDTAAAQCIVEEAGGRMTDLQFQRLRYNTKESLTNPSFVVFGDPDFNWRQRIDAVT